MNRLRPDSSSQAGVSNQGTIHPRNDANSGSHDPNRRTNSYSLGKPSRHDRRNPNERGPWFLNENVSIARTFDLQKTRLEFRFEVFNLLNRTIWGNPDSTITSANFGKVTTLNNSPRQMQLGLRWEF